MGLGWGSRGPLSSCAGHGGPVLTSCSLLCVCVCPGCALSVSFGNDTRYRHHSLLPSLAPSPFPLSSSAACPLPCSGCPLSPLASDLSLVACLTVALSSLLCSMPPTCWPRILSLDSVVQEERQYQPGSHMARHLREPAGILERPGHEVVGEWAAA